MALLEFFNVNEFDCKCKNPDCFNTYIDFRILVALDRLRRVIGLPIHINSAFRCVKHNTKIGGKINSMHLYGQAVDLKNPFNKAQFELFVSFCREIFEVVVPYPDKNFCHCHFR